MQQAPPPLSGDEDETLPIPDLCAPNAVFFAVLLAELAVVLHVLALGPLSDFDWPGFTAASLFVQWNTMLCLALICALRRALGGARPAVAAACCLVVVVAVVAVSSLLAFHLPRLLYAGDVPVADAVLRNSLIGLLLAAIVLRYAFLQQKLARQQRSGLQLRLDALRSRIRPHFLFNTLNSIASLIAVSPERAEQAIEDVAELFRAALQDAGPGHSFARERQLCELYLDLEALRLGDRLRVRWEVGGGVENEPLPSLLLQPLVENAVYHGIAPRAEGGEIHIVAQRDGARLHIRVDNPLPEAPARDAGSGQRMALDNIRERLKAQFGDDGELVAGPQGDFFRAELRLPVGDGAV
jgi:two-component system sensor histidine kinase AlgZ